MGNIAMYQSELNRYTKLKEQIINIIALLNDSTKSYEEISKKIENIYIIDDIVTPVYKKTTEQYEAINITSNNLKQNIIPKIDSKIAYLKNQIYKLSISNKEGE